MYEHNIRSNVIGDDDSVLFSTRSLPRPVTWLGSHTECVIAATSGVITPTLGAPKPILLTFDVAVEALQALSIQYGVFQSIYNYWKER
ncbi:hypothetical protein Tco_0069525, partial [Tanacetum coccineum]